MALSNITDMVTRARARILKQYAGLTLRFLPMIDVYVNEVQELENALWGLIAKFDLDVADAIWLDRLGYIVGENREGENDDVFRRLIRARIMANKSDGTVEEILAVLNMVLDDPPGMVVSFRSVVPASIEIVITGVIPFPLTADGQRLQNRCQRLLSITRAAGVRLMVIVEPIDEATSFKMSSTGALVLSARGFADATNLAAPAGHFRTAFVA